jgi:hypothetical protein
MALVLVYKPANLNAAFMLQHISWVWTLWLADCWRSTSAFDVARVITLGHHLQRYSPVLKWTSASHTTALHSSRYLAINLQFLIPKLLMSHSTSNKRFLGRPLLLLQPSIFALKYYATQWLFILERCLNLWVPLNCLKRYLIVMA